MQGTNKLTFSQYLESKQKLREALKKSPIVCKNYTVKTYCKLAIGESKLLKEILSFKPGSNITIEWKFENNNPRCWCLLVENKKHQPYWKDSKIESWLLKNTEPDD